MDSVRPQRYPRYGHNWMTLNEGVVNLNDVTADIELPNVESGLHDYATSAPDGQVTAHFRDLATHLQAYITQADLVVGCVAWLTHADILNALAAVRDGVALVVQKEDFLRPDLDILQAQGNRAWTRRLREQYARLPEGPQRQNYPFPLGYCSFCLDPTLDPVRCVGNYNEDAAPAWPRMHHKFLVFCRRTGRLTPYLDMEPLDSSVYDAEHLRANYDAYDLWTYEETDIPQPYAVWTGSFNLTKHASTSLENALYITTPEIVCAYYNEWLQLETISEPLDWEHVWVTPEWRIGS